MKMRKGSIWNKNVILGFSNLELELAQKEIKQMNKCKAQ